MGPPCQTLRGWWGLPGRYAFPARYHQKEAAWGRYVDDESSWASGSG